MTSFRLLLMAISLSLAACGGGGGGASDSPGVGDGNGNGQSPGTPAAGVYFTANNLVAAVHYATNGTSSSWTSWELVSNDERLYLGTADTSSASSGVVYFDFNGRQTGVADLRNSTSTRLKGLVTLSASTLSLDLPQVDPNRLLSLSELDQGWSGSWRHGNESSLRSGVSAIVFTAGTGADAGRRVFSPSTVTINNCFVSAKVTEQSSGQSGLFNVTLTIVQAGSGVCTRVGTYTGVLVAYQDSTGVKKLRIAATDSTVTPTLAISFVADGV